MLELSGASDGMGFCFSTSSTSRSLLAPKALDSARPNDEPLSVMVDRNVFYIASIFRPKCVQGHWPKALFQCVQ